MSDWTETLYGYMKLSKHEILAHAGKISTNIAELKAKEEYKNIRYCTAKMFLNQRKIISRY